MNGRMKFKKGIKAIDLFCGVGGLTYGLQQSGIRVVAGIDNDPSCKYAFTKNNHSKFLERGIQSLSSEELGKLWGASRVRILAGCAPCQTFSQHTKKNKQRHKDKRWGLLYKFLELVENSRPHIVTMENVPQLRNYSVFSDFVNGLERLGFYVSYRVVHCPRYGIPQNRSRLVLLASEFGKLILNPETHSPSTYLTVKDAIGHLEPVNGGQVSSKDPLHRCWKLSAINKKRIMQSKPGGSWMDWDKNIRLVCHRKSSGKSYRAVYGRMRWDAPSPTITTQFYSYGTGRFGHPEQDRAISLREGALLQTFPKKYKLSPPNEPITFNTVGKHIGNAVPVKLGKIIGLSIIKHCDEYQK